MEIEELLASSALLDSRGKAIRPTDHTLLDKKVSYLDETVVHEIADALVSEKGWTLVRLACKKTF